MTAIGFSTPRAFSLASLAIRLRTRQPGVTLRDTPSHTWLRHEAYNGTYVMESEWRGFRVISYEHFQQDNRVIAEVNVEPLLEKLGVDPWERVSGMAAWLGDSYDWRSLLAFLLPVLARGQSPRALLCSEAVVRGFPELFPGVNPERATPAELMVKLLKATK